MKKFWSKNFYQVEGGEGRREGEKERRRKGGGGVGPSKKLLIQNRELVIQKSHVTSQIFQDK